MAKTILVTGGGRGIGRGICLNLAAKGYSVVINYAGNRETAVETQLLCQDAATDASQIFTIVQADISIAHQRESLVEQAFSATGSLDGLVNNAGVGPKQRTDFLDMAEESYDRLMLVNLKGPLMLTQQITRRWRDTDTLAGKTIVFVSSVSADMVSINRGEYCISKAGVGMAASLFATRLAGEGTLVFEVRPGIIKTDLTSAVSGKYDTLIAEGLVPQMRWGTPDDIGRTVTALCDGALPFSTGAVITVDGGLHIPRL